jgi:ectoine hydroxylase-related dioxygenase (phytanoyl-CoA dioxygenase family)
VENNVKSYGVFQQNLIEDDISRHAEEISIKGYTVIPKLIPDQELEGWRHKIDEIYTKQEAEYGKSALAAIQELDVCRAPLLYDFDFINISQHPVVMSVVKKFLGEWFILNLQNAIINRPNQEHHQSSWHRDLPYQNFVISKPLAINALWAIDEFSAETGGTYLVPFTHKTEVLPSNTYIENNLVVAQAPAGSVIMFDSMLFHRAGYNKSQIIRRAINNLYTVPIIKQQYDFPQSLQHMQDSLDAGLQRLLGFTSIVHPDDQAWRKARSKRLATQ